LKKIALAALSVRDDEPFIQQLSTPVRLQLPAAKNIDTCAICNSSKAEAVSSKSS
jgi:hypothetical protein